MKAERVHGTEWLLGIAGAAILAGIFLPWSGSATGLESFDLFVLLLGLVGIASLAVPAVVSISRLTDVPIVWETLLWLAALPLLVVAVVVLFLTPPSLVHGAGAWISLGGLVVAALACWRSVRREY